MSTDGFLIEYGVFEEYTGSEPEVEIPDGVHKIRRKAFKNCHSLTSIIIPDSVTDIEDCVFEGCYKLTSITIPNSVTNIGDCVFEDCTSLTSITIPESVTNIRDRTFYCCRSLTSITIPESVTNIGECAFFNCRSLKSITIPESVTNIGDNAFEGCSSLTNITISNSVQSIGKSAFHRCESLTNISGGANTMYKDGLIIINGKLVYYNGSNSEVEIPEIVDSIGGGAFKDCTFLTSITIPISVQSIGDCAFENCSSLTSITIPESVRSIGIKAFCHCKSLVSIQINGWTKISASAFDYSGLEISKLDHKTICCLYLNDVQQTYNGILKKDAQKKILTDSDKYINVMVDLCQNSDDIKDFSKIMALITKSKDQVTNDTLVRLEEIFTEWNATAQQQNNLKKTYLQKTRTLLKQRQKEDSSKKDEADNLEKEKIVNIEKEKAEARVERLLNDYPQLKYLWLPKSRRKVYYRNSKEPVSDQVLCAILNIYRNIDLNYLVNKQTISNREVAEEIYQYIDPDTFTAFLFQGVHEKKNYQDYLLAFAQFASDYRISIICDVLKKRKRGKQSERVWADNVEKALILSQTTAAEKLYDSIGKLNLYAQFHGTTEQSIRDEQATEIPDDALKYSNSSKMQYVEDRIKNIKGMHINRNAIDKEQWLKFYIQRAAVKDYFYGIVWSDGTEYFINTETGILDINGNVYEPGEAITVAHVLDMKPGEIENWKTFLIERHIKQPFDQIWEPVFDVEQNKLDTFKGITLTQTERNAIKRNLAQKGINVYSDKLEGSYNYYTGQYEFDDFNTMHFDQYLDLNYSIAEDKSITFKSLRKTNFINQYGLNAILLELSRVFINSSIKNNQSENLKKSILDSFTLAQILSFISLANKCKSTECSLALLNYKNEKYPEYDALDELTFDL